MTEVYLQKKLGVLRGASASDEELISRLGDGVYRAQITAPRNVRFHKMYFALLNLVLQNLPETMPPVRAAVPLPSPEGGVVFEYRYLEIEVKTIAQLLYQIKILLGHYEQRVTMGGIVTIEVKSISFAKMDEFTFQDFVNRSIDVIIEHFLKGTRRQDIIEHISHYF